MKTLLIIGISFIGCSCLAAFTFGNLHSFVVPKGWPLPVYNFRENELRPAAIELGRSLFFDPILSRNGTVSCASCHLPQTAFSHTDHDLSHGIDNRIGPRNSPALMNLAWSSSFMWDGSVHHLDLQPLSPISNPDEMDESLDHVTEKLNAIPAYRKQYKEAFSDSLVTGEKTLKAISQFMLTLVSCNSKYDKVRLGEAAFEAGEAHGYQIFQQKCATCHTEPLFTNYTFENNGLVPDTSLHDTGRMKVTGLAKDLGKYKVPTLRNIEVSYPYMHDGRFRNLQMVLFHYAEGITKSAGVSKKLKGGISLTETDKRDLIAFLKTLTDEEFLNNPNFQPLKPYKP